MNTDLKTKIFTESEIEKIVAAKKQLTEAVDPFLLRHVGIVIAGGCWASTLQGEHIKDIDIFILGEWAGMRDTITELFPTIKPRDETLYRIQNENIKEVWTTPDKKIQVIFTKHVNRKDLIEDFDYLHCRASHCSGKFYITREIYDAIIHKNLILKNEKRFSEWRRDKFLGRGYTIPVATKVLADDTIPW